MDPLLLGHGEQKLSQGRICWRRDTGGQHRTHVVHIDPVLTRQLAEHPQRRPQRLPDDCRLEIGERRGDLCFIVIRPRRDCRVRSLPCGAGASRGRRKVSPGISVL